MQFDVAFLHAWHLHNHTNFVVCLDNVHEWFAFLFDFRFSSFLDMNAADQDSYLEDWMTSSLEFRRTGYQALKRTCLSMFYTDTRSFADIGYHGMFLPGGQQ